MPAVSSPPYGYASVGYLFQRPPPILSSTTHGTRKFLLETILETQGHVFEQPPLPDQFPTSSSASFLSAAPPALPTLPAIDDSPHQVSRGLPSPRPRPGDKQCEFLSDVTGRPTPS